MADIKQILSLPISKKLKLTESMLEKLFQAYLGEADNFVIKEQDSGAIDILYKLENVLGFDAAEIKVSHEELKELFDAIT